MPGIPSLFILVLFTIALFWKKRTKPINSNLRHIQTLTFKGQTPPHRIATILSELIDKDGAGAWPPKANHTSWPMALRPYKEIYLKLAPTLSVAEPSLDVNFNHDRRIKYRSAMRKLLNKEIDMGAVKALMTATEAEQWDVFTRDAYNGFYCCIAVCRHAYRYLINQVPQEYTQSDGFIGGQLFLLLRLPRQRKQLNFHQSWIYLGHTCSEGLV